MTSGEASMAREPSQLRTQGVSGLRSEIGRGRIAEAAYNHMRDTYGQLGWDFNLSFDLNFSLFDDVAAREPS
jgi:hypothetical protein